MAQLVGNTAGFLQRCIRHHYVSLHEAAARAWCRPSNRLPAAARPDLPRSEPSMLTCHQQFVWYCHSTAATAHRRTDSDNQQRSPQYRHSAFGSTSGDCPEKIGPDVRVPKQVSSNQGANPQRFVAADPLRAISDQSALFTPQVDVALQLCNIHHHHRDTPFNTCSHQHRTWALHAMCSTISPQHLLSRSHACDTMLLVDSCHHRTGVIQ